MDNLYNSSPLEYHSPCFTHLNSLSSSILNATTQSCYLVSATLSPLQASISSQTTKVRRCLLTLSSRALARKQDSARCVWAHVVPLPGLCRQTHRCSLPHTAPRLAHTSSISCWRRAWRVIHNARTVSGMELLVLRERHSWISEIILDFYAPRLSFQAL